MCVCEKERETYLQRDRERKDGERHTDRKTGKETEGDNHRETELTERLFSKLTFQEEKCFEKWAKQNRYGRQ